MEVSALGLGCLGLSFGSVTPTDEAMHLIRTAFDRGVILFDTAQAYGELNETLVGQALAQELGIGFVPFSPLGKGFLTGKIDENTAFSQRDFRNTVPASRPRRAKPTKCW